MATSGVMTYNYATVNTAVKKGDYNTLVKESSTLDQNDYLQLMMAQMTHQDPLEPQGTEQMMSQMTQLSSTQALTELTSTMKASALGQGVTNASALIGKAVYGKDSNGDDLEGEATSAVVKDGVAYVNINDGTTSGALMKLTDILMVQDKSILSKLTS